MLAGRRFGGPPRLWMPPRSGDHDEALKSLIQKKSERECGRRGWFHRAALGELTATTARGADARADSQPERNVNAATDLGATPLCGRASQNGSVAMVRRLLDAGANPNLALLLFG